MNQDTTTQSNTAGNCSASSGRPEEDEDIWVPLSMAEEEQDFVGVTALERPRQSGAESVASHHPSNSTSTSQSTVTTVARANATGSKHSSSLQLIQQKLETKVSIQNNLVNHPIDLFWKRFLINLVQELWTLEVRIRSGILLLILGQLARLFVISFWYMLYPRVAILSCVFFASFVYLDPLALQLQGKAVLEAILNPEKAIQAIEKLDVQHIRRLSAVLFLFPTLLEVRTLLFLSHVSAETEWMTYHIGIGVTLLGTMLYLLHHRRAQPRDATYHGMLIAYGSALLASFCMYNIRRMPFLAAPFLTATGTLLLTYQDDDMEWMSRVVRHALRVSLRDVLASVGTRVNQDEMLQLAILRWISDFWAENPGAPPKPPSTTSSNSGPQDESPQSGSADTEASNQQSSSVPVQCDSSLAVASQRPPLATRPPSSQPQREVRWEELLPMLNIEIDHMEDEAETLQSDRPGELMPLRIHSVPDQQHRPQHSGSLDPFDDLKVMLMSLSVDERAKPAVQAYRRAVESFPPPKRWAVILSVVRRCPATIAFAFRLLFGETRYLFASILFLSPFMVMEYYRVLHWTSSCRQVVDVAGETSETNDGTDWVVPKELKTVDTMTILLCGDNHTALRPPTLLRVWHNIVSSVSALEVGLTAARCAETTAVAADFAGNVMSLVQFGVEVAEKGLLHGLGVVVKEAIYMGGDFSNLDRIDDGSVRYTRAAVHALQSGHRVARSVHALSEDEHVGAFVQPVLGALGVVIGHGWLWGKDDQAEPATTVVIEEIHEEDVATKQTSQDQTFGDTQAVESTIPTQMEQLIVDSKSSSPEDRVQQEWECSRIVSSSNEDVDRKYTKGSALDDVKAAKLPGDELSEVMDLVATAYENGLIEDEEKADFYEKLSKLGKDELTDPLVIASMKRTLQIVLDNGCETSLVDTTENGGQEPVVSSDPLSLEPDKEPIEPGAQTQAQGTGFVCRDDHDDQLSASNTESQERDDRPSNANTGEGSNNDALLKFGAAALGVIAGGVLLSMAGQGDGNRHDGDRSDRRFEEAEAGGRTERNQSSTVVIEELSEDDDEWVSVPQ